MKPKRPRIKNAVKVNITARSGRPANPANSIKYSSVRQYCEKETQEIKPLPDKWNDCVWIRSGKIEKKVRRDRLVEYPDWEIMTKRSW